MPLNSAYDDSSRAVRTTIVGGSLGNSGNVTLNASTNSIGFATVFNQDGLLRAGEDLTADVQKVEQRYSYYSLNSLVTATVKSSAGFLHTVTVGGYSGPTIELYDNTAASGSLIGRIGNSITPQTLIYDVTFATGLTVNPQPGTAVLPNLSISYR